MSDPTSKAYADDKRVVCFTIEEGHLILWALAEAMANTQAADALSEVAFLRPVIPWFTAGLTRALEE